MIDCKIFHTYQGTGVAVVTTSYRVFVINNIEDPRIRKMAEVPGEITWLCEVGLVCYIVC